MKIPFHFKSIGNRLIFWFCLVAVLSFLFFSIVSFYQMYQSIYTAESSKLTAIRDLKTEEINVWLDKIMGDVKNLSQNSDINNIGRNLCLLRSVPAGDFEVLNDIFDGYLTNYNVYYEFFIVSSISGKIVYSTIRDNIGADRSNNLYTTETINHGDLFIKDIYYSTNLNIPTMTFSIPINSDIPPARKYAGIVVARIYLERSLYNLLLDRTGLGKTGESYVINSNLQALNKLRGYDGFPLSLKMKDTASHRALRGESGVIETRDYRGNAVLCAYRFLPRLKWGFIVKQDSDELFRPLYDFIWKIFMFLVISGFIAFTIARTLAGTMSGPLNSLISVSDRIKDGDYSYRYKSDREDEFNVLAESLNTMADMIISQLNIQKVSSDIIQVMVSTLNLDEFSKNVLSKFVEVTESSLGAFYILSPDGRVFNHLTSIGLDVDSVGTFHAGRLEGEFGKALATREIAITKNISQKAVVKLRTIVGDIVPSEIMTIPIIVNNRTVAIISLASLSEYPGVVLKILNQVRPVMNTAFSNILSDEETRRLAGELADKNSLLESQKDALESQAAELRRQSDRVRKQNIELESQHLKVEEANKLKSEFLSNMSHELRTPLNSILALAHVLLLQSKNKLSEEELGYLEVIDRNGQKLLILINDILDLSKIEAGRIDLKIRKLSLVSVIGMIVDNMEQIAEDKGIGLKLIVRGDIPSIESDESRVYQIFQNIIGNAVKFTEKGGVTLTITATAKKVQVSVEDTGIGIEQKELPHIFEEFRQIDGTLSRKYDGTGLGLAIASKSAQLIMGRIKVQSRVGKGSKFDVIVPVKWRSPADNPGEKTENGRDKYDAAFSQVNLIFDNDTTVVFDQDGDDTVKDAGNKKVKILAVDDDSDNILALRAVLQEEFHIFEAYDGNDAIKIAMSEMPDIILLDMALPGTSGFNVVKELKSRPKSAKIPVIALTALTMSGDRERILGAGCDDYIPKPFDVKELIKTIRKRLKEKHD